MSKSSDSQPASVDLYWSFRSPYSYLALHHVRALAAANEVHWNVKIVRPLAMRTPDFFKRMDPLWRPYLLLDTKRIAEQLGMPFKRPTPDPVSQDPETLVISDVQPYIQRLTRLGAESMLRGRPLAFINAVSDLLWNGQVVGWDQGDHLARAAERAGLDLADMEAAIAADPGSRDRLIEQNEADLRATGHWGVPTFVYEGEPFFGQDRIPLLLWRIGQRQAA